MLSGDTVRSQTPPRKGLPAEAPCAKAGYDVFNSYRYIAQQGSVGSFKSWRGVMLA
jgi:hypothetical protein